MPMPRATSTRRLLPSITTPIAVLVSIWALPAAAQPVEELIRAHVEQLRATGDLELDGVSIAERDLLPRIYEARAFAPTWRSQTQIDSLLETIEESYREGLDPRDYHVDEVRAARAGFANVDALPAPSARRST